MDEVKIIYSKSKKDIDVYVKTGSDDWYKMTTKPLITIGLLLIAILGIVICVYTFHRDPVASFIFGLLGPLGLSFFFIISSCSNDSPLSFCIANKVEDTISIIPKPMGLSYEFPIMDGYTKHNWAKVYINRDEVYLQIDMDNTYGIPRPEQIKIYNEEFKHSVYNGAANLSHIESFAKEASDLINVNNLMVYGFHIYNEDRSKILKEARVIKGLIERTLI